MSNVNSVLDEYYRSEQTKDIKSIVKAIKSKRNLRNGYIDYNQYIAEQLDKNIKYGEYILENLNKTISYTEYISEQVSKNISY